MNVLETHALTKAYGKVRAVDALDMHVAEGDIYGFVGKNGAGKSTVMKIAAGLVLPTSGEIELFGDASASGHTGAAIKSGASAATHENASSTRAGDFSRIGALIEEPGLLPGYSAFENLMTKALAIGVIDAERHCEDLLALVGLSDARNMRAKKLSLGMKQRLGLALALVGGPDLLLLDEPFNGMDPEATRDLRRALVQLNQERSVTMVISSHVLDQLDRMATRFGVIRAGHMVREFTAETLHDVCGTSLRVRTADSARTLALLEERLPGALFRAEPDDSLLISGNVAPEEVSRILHDADQVVLEFTRLEHDIEDYFVSLMGGADEDNGTAESTGTAKGAHGPKPPRTKG